METKEVKIAYIRNIEKTGQCDLTFWLVVTHGKCGSINQEIKSLRQIKDNIASLLTHTKNKIIKLFQENGMNEIESQVLNKDMDISLSRNDQEFPGTTTCEELLQYKHKIKFKIFGVTYRVIVNAPLIQTLTIPNFIFANTCIKPLRLKGIHMHKGLSKYKWSRSKDKIQWVDVFYEVNYNTTPEDLNHYLKLTCSPYSSDRTPGPVVEVVSENTVDILPELPLNSPQYKYREAHTKDKLEGRSVRVISYNILAERYTDDAQFIYCDPKFLSIDYRKQLLFEEIMGYKADLICLQEVDLDHYHDYFKTHFRNNNYVPIFYKKGNKIPEGLSFIYDRNRFKQINCKHIVFSRELKKPLFQDVWNLIKKQKEVKELFMKQHTSLLLVTLKLIGTNDILIIANTHLYYHYEAGHIRLLQVVMALKYIKSQFQDIKAKEAGKIYVLFCGDFNSRPDSSVYHLLTQGHTRTCEEPLDNIGGKNCKVFQHDLNFKSACGTPKYTNYTDDFKGCLDYIFCQQHIEITQVVPFPPEEELAKHTALPNQHFPSDHIALVVDLTL